MSFGFDTMNGEYRRSALGEYSALEDARVETANVERISSESTGRAVVDRVRQNSHNKYKTRPPPKGTK